MLVEFQFLAGEGHEQRLARGVSSSDLDSADGDSHSLLCGRSLSEAAKSTVLVIHSRLFRFACVHCRLVD